MILVVDNYDSFVFNLARYLTRLGCTTRIVRNDALEAVDVRRMAPQAIVLSPGPCAPREAGRSLELAAALVDHLPILGICLGHQVIAEALGGRVMRSPRPRHGRASPIRHDGRGVFAGLPHPLSAARYHSLTVDEDSLPDCLEVTARADDGLVMGLAHRRRPVVGLQFHPESILTPCGYALLANFLRLAGIDALPADRLAASEINLPRRQESAPRAPVTY